MYLAFTKTQNLSCEAAESFLITCNISDWWWLTFCRTNWKSKKKKKKKGKDGRLDLYALLGLQNERWTATDAQIKLGESTQPALLRCVQEVPHLSDGCSCACLCMGGKLGASQS